MTTTRDVAAYLLSKLGKMTTMKLQKLVYYAQAWSLVWDDKPLFDDRIEAWANGPVCPDLYSCHKGMFDIAPGGIEGDETVFDAEERKTLDAVCEYYGDKTSHWLSQLTHEEDPWKSARRGLDAGERGTAQITLASMAEYYGSL